MIGTLDIHQAIVRLWNANELTNKFWAYWTNAEKSGRHRVLNSEEARPKNPRPFCVFETTDLTTTERASPKTFETAGREIRSLDLTFNIHAADKNGVAAKQIAGNLAEEIMKIFGGHPTVSPECIAPTNCDLLRQRLEQDTSVRMGEQEYQHVLRYFIQVDCPVAV
jgi:hypothetical protein